MFSNLDQLRFVFEQSVLEEVNFFLGNCVSERVNGQEKKPVPRPDNRFSIRSETPDRGAEDPMVKEKTRTETTMKNVVRLSWSAFSGSARSSSE